MKTHAAIVFTALMAVALSSMWVPGAAYAGEAHVCHSKVQKAQIQPTPSNPRPQMPVLTDKTAFTCPGIGVRTIPQLAETGWSIVQVQGQNEGFVGPVAKLSFTLVIQKGS
ncbi:MAG TPA: hypothetical protein VFJ15_08135 [Oleiagrimonas sp.]|nr:hypothetical protein [Oleiagrimonas sp.]